jgi:hypothetical protein
MNVCSDAHRRGRRQEAIPGKEDIRNRQVICLIHNFYEYFIADFVGNLRYNPPFIQNQNTNTRS